MKEPIRELRCHYLVTCVYNNDGYDNSNGAITAMVITLPVSVYLFRVKFDVLSVITSNYC